MTIKEIETKLKELAENEKSIKAEIDNMQIALSEAISKEKAKAQIPNDVRDIPIALPLEYYKEYDGYKHYYLLTADGSFLSDSKKEQFMQSDTEYEKCRAFPSIKYIRDYCEKTQLLAYCSRFKFQYDKDYIPNWNNDFEPKNFVSFSFEENMFVRDVTFCFDVNSVYFSDEIIAEKCADWLNFIYKKGKYTND